MAVYLTFDIDWAPDCVLDYVVDILGDVRATFLVTHATEMLEKLVEHHHELGWHPNFMKGSSHGNSPIEVLQHMARLAPEAKCVRSHNYVCDTTILDLYVERGIKVDVSLLEYLNPRIRPFVYWNGLVRCPTFWEDDIHFLRHDHYKPEIYLPHGDGTLVYAFHPIHVFLNSESATRYQSMKRGLLKPLNQASHDEIRGAVNSGVGTRTVLLDLLDRIRQKEFAIGSVSELAESAACENWLLPAPHRELTTQATARDGS